jgi:subtilisin
VRRARPHRLLVLLALCALVVVPAASANAHDQEYIVVLVPGTDPGTFAGRLGAIAERTYSAALDGFVARLSPGQLQRVQNDPAVQGVVQDGDGFTFDGQTVPTGVSRVGGPASPTADIDGIDDARVNADIAIIDSGVDSDNPELNVQTGQDCGGTGSTEDFIGHGTAVAGVAAAIDDGNGVVGVAPGARIWPVSIENKSGKIRASAVLCALDWVTQHAATIEVANMSFDDSGRDDGNCGVDSHGKVHDPIHAAVCAAVDAGVTITVSAGNRARDAARFIPAAYDEVITVSALADTDGAPGGNGPDCFGEQDDTFASFSNFGHDVDIAAPGVCIESTAIGGGDSTFTGTSFSAPHVAGAAALWIAGHPGAGPDDVKQAIVNAREDVHLDGDPDGTDEGVLDVSTF